MDYLEKYVSNIYFLIELNQRGTILKWHRADGEFDVFEVYVFV